MGTLSLNDIAVSPLARIPVQGGDVLHAMKKSDSGYAGFGEAYLSCVQHGVVKAWKRHLRMTMNIIVPVGLVRFVFAVEGEQQFRIETIGDAQYSRITVPPGVWFGFQGVAATESMVLNLASIEHDPEEVERLPVSAMPFVWE